MAANIRSARYEGSEIVAPARKGFEAKFEREVDPDGVLPKAERQRRAKAAMRAHMQKLALAREQKKRR